MTAISPALALPSTAGAVDSPSGAQADAADVQLFEAVMEDASAADGPADVSTDAPADGDAQVLAQIHAGMRDAILRDIVADTFKLANRKD